MPRRDIDRRIEALEAWRREHEVKEAGTGDRVLHSKWFWILIVLALIGSITGSGALARLFGWI